MTIVLADPYVPRNVDVTPIEYGGVMRSSHGGAGQRLIRPGKRFRCAFEFPPMEPDKARLMLSRLLSAQDEGIRLPFPLLDIDQTFAGAPVVDTSYQTGASIALTGFTAGAVVNEGWWLNLVDANGRHYLHNARAQRTADGAGKMSLPINPAIRAPFVAGNAVLITEPKFEGELVEGLGWSLTVERIVAGLTLVVEELV